MKCPINDVVTSQPEWVARLTGIYILSETCGSHCLPSILFVKFCLLVPSIFIMKILSSEVYNILLYDILLLQLSERLLGSIIFLFLMQFRFMVTINEVIIINNFFIDIIPFKFNKNL